MWIQVLSWRIVIIILESTCTPHPENWNIWGLSGNLWNWGAPGHHRDLTRAFRHQFVWYFVIFKHWHHNWHVTNAFWFKMCRRHLDEPSLKSFPTHFWKENSDPQNGQMRERKTQSARVDSPRYNKQVGHLNFAHSECMESFPMNCLFMYWFLCFRALFFLVFALICPLVGWFFLGWVVEPQSAFFFLGLWLGTM